MKYLFLILFVIVVIVLFKTNPFAYLIGLLIFLGLNIFNFMTKEKQNVKRYNK